MTLQIEKISYLIYKIRTVYINFTTNDSFYGQGDTSCFYIDEKIIYSLGSESLKNSFYLQEMFHLMEIGELLALKLLLFNKSPTIRQQFHQQGIHLLTYEFQISNALQI